MMVSEQSRRPPRNEAYAAAANFLRSEGLDAERFHLVEDGVDCWAFWLDEDDTTSYVHPDLGIEWYGTATVHNGNEESSDV
ncbi:MAG: hypothetical protein ACYTEX_10970 [Planctomycetota bacterium]|jgi:hypothetical protein